MCLELILEIVLDHSTVPPHSTPCELKKYNYLIITNLTGFSRYEQKLNIKSEREIINRLLGEIQITKFI